MKTNARSILAILALAGGCRSGDPAPRPILDDVGEYHRAVTTRSAEARHSFNQGLLLTFGFDHEQATENYRRALEKDPDLAMAWWGIAFAAGPHINNPAMDESQNKTAHEAIERALALAPQASPVERDLIEALAKRYAWPAPKDRRPFDEAFAAAMREVWKRHPRDADVGALFAEALMDLRPWDLWTREGQPQPETPEIVETLEAVLAMDPRHPSATHLLIHALEASPHPERALAAADRLRDRVPGASHLVHMPSHIYMRVGQYLDAVRANQRAVEVDQKRIARVGRGGFYALYRAHNYHFLMWSAMFDGQGAVAMQAARDVVANLPVDVVRSMPEFVESFMASPLHVMVRFGRWEDILREPEPPKDFYGTTAAWRYARGLAFSTLGRVNEASDELAAFERAYAAVPETYSMGNNPVRTILGVARLMLGGELEYRKGNFDAGFTKLREAVAVDDSLRYDEPWGWVQPVRHALGALLTEQGRFEEAEQVYRRDLERHPNNGWALHGLEECLRARGAAREADSVRARFDQAWARADVKLRGSCFCRTGGP